VSPMSPTTVRSELRGLSVSVDVVAYCVELS